MTCKIILMWHIIKQKEEFKTILMLLFKSGLRQLKHSTLVWWHTLLPYGSKECTLWHELVSQNIYIHIYRFKTAYKHYW